MKKIYKLLSFILCCTIISTISIFSTSKLNAKKIQNENFSDSQTTEPEDVEVTFSGLTAEQIEYILQQIQEMNEKT